MVVCFYINERLINRMKTHSWSTLGVFNYLNLELNETKMVRKDYKLL